nr:hypothetical protein [Paracoccus saliphilus]
MDDDLARARLAAVPASMRETMLAHRKELPAGAITTAARFFTILAEQGEHSSAPSRATFEAACRSESTLALLLRLLGRYAPSVCLAEGRALRQEYYRRRPGGSGHQGRTASVALPARSETAPRNWPASWLALLPGLRAAAIKDSSISRHIASINRCADMLVNVKCPPRLGWLLAWELSQEARREDAAEGKVAVNDRTAASYIGGLVSLGLHGGLETEALDGMRAVQALLIRKARRIPKQKESRLHDLYGQGGYDEIMRAILRELEEADRLPDWSAEAATARATAAVLAVCMNDPARTGDVAQWTFGEQLVREPWDHWQLRWRQEKTGWWKDAGTLWPEIGQVLDEHILGGRPRRHAHRRYEELRGLNWLSLTPQAYASRWPSERVRDAIGVPLHDLRTLVADYLRMHDPASAPKCLAALLGHRTLDAGKAYQALCVETAAQREWREVRESHAAGLQGGRRRKRLGAGTGSPRS